MPKILILSRHIKNEGFRQRIALYFDSLKTAGIEYNVELLPSKTYKTLKLFGAARVFDAVLLYRKRLSPIERFFLRKNARKIIYDFDDPVMLDFQNSQKPHAGKLKKFTATIKMADTIIASNSHLANLAKKINDNTVVIPTGLDTAEYEVEKRQSTDGKIRLVWIGSGSTLTYLKQIREVLEQIGKKYKNVILRIICNEFFDLQSLPVEKIQWSLKTQAPDVANSDIGLAPLGNDDFAANKSCFKILQYEAASLPTVAGSAGANAELMSDGVTGFLADNPQQWFDCLEKLIENPRLRCKMGQEAKKFVKKFDASVLGGRFVDIILKTITEPTGKPTAN
jgi:glycosyltransferase involved in cell wall biosynthesis